MFYEQSGGGVTLSGGEVMMQNIDQLEDLCRRLHQEGIHLAIDTCGFAPTENYQRILPYVDVFLYDIKALDEEVHQAYTGQSNKLILENLEFLAKNRANINIRIPVIDPVNANEEFMKDVISYLKEKVGIVKVNLLPYHNTGSSKYAKMELVYPSEEFRVPSEEQMESFKQLFMDNGFSQVKIGG
jgi:pyruvate formate lyase activating enzyme